MMIRNVMYLLIILILTSFAYATDFGYNSVYLPTLQPDETTTTTTSSSNATDSNASEYWITNIGSLDDVNSSQFVNEGGVLSILVSWLESLFYYKSEVNTTIDDKILEFNSTLTTGGDGGMLNNTDLIVHNLNITGEVQRYNRIEITNESGYFVYINNVLKHYEGENCTADFMNHSTIDLCCNFNC